MVNAKISCFGKFDIEQSGCHIELKVAPKAQELLCYIIIHQQQPFPREALSEILWENHPPRKSRKYLRQAIWQLQSSLKLHGNHIYSLILVDPKWVCFNSDANCSVDVRDFERVFNQINILHVHDMQNSDFDLVQDALKLYKGNFLEGWYQEWCIVERERYQRMYLVMLDKIIQYCEINQKYDVGLVYGARILCMDRASERAHRQMMRLYMLSGDRSQAIRQYKHCEEALCSELGVAPSERTKQLYEQIRADTFRSPAFNNKPDSAKTRIGLSGLINHLESYEETLHYIQNQLHKDISSIEESPNQQD